MCLIFISLKRTILRSEHRKIFKETIVYNKTESTPPILSPTVSTDSGGVCSLPEPVCVSLRVHICTQKLGCRFLI